MSSDFYKLITGHFQQRLDFHYRTNKRPVTENMKYVAPIFNNVKTQLKFQDRSTRATPSHINPAL